MSSFILQVMSPRLWTQWRPFILRGRSGRGWLPWPSPDAPPPPLSSETASWWWEESIRYSSMCQGYRQRFRLIRLWLESLNRWMNASLWRQMLRVRKDSWLVYLYPRPVQRAVPSAAVHCEFMWWAAGEQGCVKKRPQSRLSTPSHTQHVCPSASRPHTPVPELHADADSDGR